MKCLVCKSKNHKIIWNDRIRISGSSYSKNKKKILQCLKCKLVFLAKTSSHLEDSSVARNIYNNNNSIKEFLKFHTKREIKKLNFIKKYINLTQPRSLLESNCGAGIVINQLKRKIKLTCGLDSEYYRKAIEETGHIFFSNINQIINKKLKFDFIVSFSELEHKKNPLIFLNNLKKIMTKKSILAIRVPNFYNIYKFMIEKNFLKDDFRESHNFYFSENNLDLLFKKLKFKTISKYGFNEYSANHLLKYIQLQERVKNKKVEIIFNHKINNLVINNIQNNLISTSLIYLLKI